MKKQKPVIDPSSYKTEEMLKEEAKARAVAQAVAAAKAPPVSPQRKKAENFWYHYKWAAIGGAVALFFVAFLLKDMMFRTNPDITIIVTTGQYLQPQELEALESALSAVIPDRNGDGKQVVALDYISLPAEPTEEEDTGPNLSGQMDYASIMKLTTVVAAGIDPLFLVDDAAYDHLADMAGEDASSSVFRPLTEISGADGDRLPLSATLLAEDPALAGLADLTLCLRTNSNPSDKEAATLAYCQEVLELLAR